MPRDTADRLAIREIIENWVIWRDARMWDRFRTLWHSDGQMWATWFQGSHEDFIKVSQQGFDRGVRIMHMLGGTSIDIKGKRAIAQSKMTISQRAKVEGVECDVVCTGRFYDFLEKRKGAGAWCCAASPMRRTASIRSIRRPSWCSTAPIWRNSRKATGTSPICRARSATQIKSDMPGHAGPELETLYSWGANWLKGKKLPAVGPWRAGHLVRFSGARKNACPGSAAMSLAANFNLLNEFNILRIICGLFFIPHIYGKFYEPAALGFFVAAKFKPPKFWMYLSGTIETVLAIGLIFGIFTTLAGAIAAIHLGVATVAVARLTKKWLWNIGGYEYCLFWAICCLVVAMHAYRIGGILG